MCFHKFNWFVRCSHLSLAMTSTFFSVARLFICWHKAKYLSCIFSETRSDITRERGYKELCIMKIIIVAALVVSVVCGSTVKTWTYDELEKVLHDKNFDPELKPYLEEAFNAIVYSMFTNKNLDLTSQSLISPKGSSIWTMEELDEAIKDPSTNPNYLPAITESYRYLKSTHEHGNKPENSIKVYVRAMDISTWTLAELNEAIANPATNPELIHYLETARTKLTSESEFQNKETISIVTKVGLVHKVPNLQPVNLDEIFKKSN